MNMSAFATNDPQGPEGMLPTIVSSYAKLFFFGIMSYIISLDSYQL
jgi:hypothetical protein